MTTSTANSYTANATAINESRSRFLRRVLWGNAIFSTLCALIILLDLSTVTAFMGWPLQWPLALLGIGLLPFALFVATVARKQPFNKMLAWVVIELDLAWVIASATILLLGWPASTTVGGRWAIGVIAEIVATFAILQYIGVRRLSEK